jgi:hypothetical protein
MEKFIYIFIYAIQIYLLIGLLFTIVFLFKGLTKVDVNATGTKIGFKLLILPGAIALWPILLYKWIKS